MRGVKDIALGTGPRANQPHVKRGAKYFFDNSGINNQTVRRNSGIDAKMKIRFCFVFVIFYLTAVSIFAVCLRSANNRVYYKLCNQRAEQSRLKQQLGNKQLRFENLISPTIVAKHLED